MSEMICKEWGTEQRINERERNKVNQNRFFNIVPRDILNSDGGANKARRTEDASDPHRMAVGPIILSGYDYRRNCAEHPSTPTVRMLMRSR